MTKIEYSKCENLMYDAIQKVKQADEEYKAYNQLINNDTIKAEIEQRKADRHMGYAEGVNQVLAVIGFKHDRMKELSELL